GDLAQFATPEAEHIALNARILSAVDDFHYSNNSVKKIDKYEIIPFEEFQKNTDIEHLSKKYLGLSRLETDKKRQKFLDKFKTGLEVNYSEALKNGVSAD